MENWETKPIEMLCESTSWVIKSLYSIDKYVYCTSETTASILNSPILIVDLSMGLNLSPIFNGGLSMVYNNDCILPQYVDSVYWNH